MEVRFTPGTANERRDREAKLKLYSTQGVQEYWLANYQLQTVEVYRRESAQLKLVATLLANDEITSPLLPGFRCAIQQFFSWAEKTVSNYHVALDIRNLTPPYYAKCELCFIFENPQ